MNEIGKAAVAGPTSNANDSIELTAVREWVNSVVIGLNLCPFAVPFWQAGRVRLVCTAAASEQLLLESLYDELLLLEQSDPSYIETTLVVAPNILADFDDYNQFLDLGDALIVESGWEGVFQIASFHPDYRFAHSTLDDPANLTNRSPYPLFHLLRESSITRVLSNRLEVEQIPLRNAELLQSMDATQRAKLFGYLSDAGRGAEGDPPISDGLGPPGNAVAPERNGENT